MSQPLYDQVQRDMRLFTAIEHGNLPQFEQALADGGNPLCKDSVKDTLLHKAAASDRISAPFMRRVLQLGIPVNAQNDAGETPLHIACWKGHGSKLRRLLKAGADPNMQTHKGLSVFHLLQSEGIDVPRVLHLAGADDRLLDGEGRTAEEYHNARGQGYMLSNYEDWLDRQSVCDAAVQPPSANTLRMWDNPFTAEDVSIATWKKLPQALQAAQEADTPIAPAILTRIACNASRHFQLPQVMEALHSNGYRLQKDALLNAEGQWHPEAVEMLHNGEAGHLFSRENWRGADAESLSRTAHALPEDMRDMVENLAQLRIALQRDALAANIGRGR
jgi:hypothetical protein